MFEPLDILSRIKNSAVESAFLVGILREHLRKTGRDDLIPYIRWVRVSGDRVIVRTDRPIVNAELRTITEPLAIAFMPIVFRAMKGRTGKVRLFFR